MAVLALVGGSVALFVAAFVACCTLWHRRLASRFERVPVRTGRSVRMRREGMGLGRDPE
jgi:hypothetical protein